VKNFFLHIIEDIIRNISGGLGTRLRYSYYKRRLGACGKRVVIDTGVFLVNPRHMRLGDNIWIDKNCILVAGPLELTKNTRQVDSGTIVNRGEIHIGDNSHIGIGTVIQGHGGVTLAEYFTSSAHCRIYSYSNDYRLSQKGTMGTGNDEDLFYIMSPVHIGKNVWLGLNVSVISTTIGADVFVMPHTVVFKPIAANSVVGGNPAAVLKSRLDSRS
jgi:acetyltransferase-like isoleucine patch superfamily enzyme